MLKETMEKVDNTQEEMDQVGRDGNSKEKLLEIKNTNRNKECF